MATWRLALALACMAAGCGDNVEPYSLQLALVDGCPAEPDGDQYLVAMLTTTNISPTAIDPGFGCNLVLAALDPTQQPVVRQTYVDNDCGSPYAPPSVPFLLPPGQQISEELVLWDIGVDPPPPGIYTFALEVVESPTTDDVGHIYAVTNRIRVALPGCTPG